MDHEPKRLGIAVHIPARQTLRHHHNERDQLAFLLVRLSSKWFIEQRTNKIVVR